jgi:hypothetical protein
LITWAAWAASGGGVDEVLPHVERVLPDLPDTPRGRRLAAEIRARVARAIDFEGRCQRLGSVVVRGEITAIAAERARTEGEAYKIALALVRTTGARAEEAAAAALAVGEGEAWHVLACADSAALERQREGRAAVATEQDESDRSRCIRRAQHGAKAVLAQLPAGEDFAAALAARYDLAGTDAEDVAKTIVASLLAAEQLTASPYDPEDPFSGFPADPDAQAVEAAARRRAAELKTEGRYQLANSDWRSTSDNTRHAKIEALLDRPEARARAETARVATIARRDLINAYLAQRTARYVKRAPRELVFDLHNEPGLLGDIARWCSSYAFRPVPEFALPATLGFLAALFGRRFATPTGLGLNLYLVGIAQTGGGKDALVSAPKALLAAAGFRHLIGPGDFTSDAALEKVVRARPVQVMCIDEFGKLAQAMMGRTAPSWARLAAKVLLELYPRSAPMSEWSGKERAGDSRDSAGEPVHSPTLSLVGVSTPVGFFEGMTDSTLEDGMLNRLTLVVGGAPGARQKDPARLTAPPSLLDAIRAAYDGSNSGNLSGARSRDAGAPQNIRCVPWADGAAEAAIEAVEGWEDEARDAGRAGICGRAAEQTQKVATLRALARNPARPTVTAEDVEWAWAFVRESIRALEDGARQFMASSAFEELVKTIEREVTRVGYAGMPFSKLTEVKGVAKAEPRMVEAALTRLQERGVITVEMSSGPRGGRPGKRVRLRSREEE